MPAPRRSSSRIQNSVGGDLTRTAEIQIPFRFTPRAYQVIPFNDIQNGIKRIGLCWHRRSGKDKTCWNLLISEACRKVGTYFYVFPLLNQARKAIWQARGKDGIKFLDHIPPALIDGEPKDTEMLVKLWNGSIIQLLGSDNADAYRGTNPVGVVFSEFAFTDPKVWNMFRPILAENGGFAIFNSTPAGKNHYYDLKQKTEGNPRWHWTTLTVDQTTNDDGSPVVTEDMIEEDRLSGMDEEFLQQEYYCSFTGSMIGSYYGRLVDEAEREGRIGVSIQYDPVLPVYTAWDIGTRDTTTVWFYQKKNRGIYFIDYFEDSGEGVEHYIKHLYQQRYTYAKHYTPHDIKKRDFSTGKSAIAVAETLTNKTNFFTVVPVMDVETGIQAVRSIFPRCFFNSIKCKRGIDALKDYHKRWDAERKIFSPTPDHSWSSHAADGFRIFATSFEEPLMSSGELKTRRPSRVGAPDSDWMRR